MCNILNLPGCKLWLVKIAVVWADVPCVVNVDALLVLTLTVGVGCCCVGVTVISVPILLSSVLEGRDTNLVVFATVSPLEVVEAVVVTFVVFSSAAVNPWDEFCKIVVIFNSWSVVRLASVVWELVVAGVGFCAAKVRIKRRMIYFFLSCAKFQNRSI